MIIPHSQYYTSEKIATLLVDCISKADVNAILDLGAGDGALSIAATQKWRSAKCYVADIDEKNCRELRERGFETNNTDCLIPNLGKCLGFNYGSIDIGVCNPPYETIENSDFIKGLMKEARLEINKGEKVISSDLVFLAYNLLFLKPNGVLGIIVPYSIMAGKKYSQLRESLIKNYYLERVIELPERSFTYTEAKTGILVIRKERSSGRKTNLNSVAEDFVLSESLIVPHKQLILRLDFSYHNWRLFNRKTLNIDNNEVKIVRGNRTHGELEVMALPFFHTTCYNRDDIDWHYPYDKSEKGIIGYGSFLIARVGKRCVGRVRFVDEGHILISDCIYGITVPHRYIECFKSFFLTQEYFSFINVATRGICSQYICKSDLKDFLEYKLEEFKRREYLGGFAVNK